MIFDIEKKMKQQVMKNAYLGPFVMIVIETRIALISETYLLIGQKEDLVIFWANLWNCNGTFENDWGCSFRRVILIGYSNDLVRKSANQEYC